MGSGGLDEVRFLGKPFYIRDADDVHAIPAVGVKFIVAWA
jgi:hypothetical protein